MKYYLGEKRAGAGLKWLVGLCLVAVGLLVWDYVQYGSLMTYVFTGIK